MTFFAECLMAWRLWFTRGLLNKAQGWRIAALSAEMQLQEREEDKWRARRRFAEGRVLDAEDEYDMARAEYAALTKGEYDGS